MTRAEADVVRTALALVRAGRGFDAHELLEDIWRVADPAERDLFQGLVHVAVATYQEGRGNEIGRRLQLEKVERRLGSYAPAYEGLDIAAALAWSRESLVSGRCPPLPAIEPAG